jgi:spore coat protein U-like protein
MTLRTTGLIRAAVFAVSLSCAALAPQGAQALLCGTVLDPIVVSATALNFGVYDSTTASPNRANATITVSCTIPVDLLTDFTLKLSTGNAASYAPRKMASGTPQLSYNLYTSSGYSTVWGDGTGGTAYLNYGSVLALFSQQFTVYGQVPIGQYVAAGTYSDTIIVTMEY